MLDRKIGLTIFLLKDSKIASFEEKLANPFRSFAIPLSEPLDGFFIPLPAADDGLPSWVEPIGTVLAQPIRANMNAKAPGGLLVIRRSGRVFVITFGHAWQKLEDAWLETDFGLRVALNSIPRKELLEVRAEQIFAKWHLASERAPRASSVEEFGVNFDRDLVSVLEGIPSLSPSLGKTIRGSTSLKVNLPISDLEQVLDVSLDRFTSRDYKSDWPEMDNIIPLKDEDIIQLLEDQLDSDLRDPTARSKIVMFTPSQRKGEPFVADSYVYGRLSKNHVSSPYLTVDGWLSTLAHSGSTPSVALAKQFPVHMFDESGTTARDFTAFACFGYEYSDGNRVYVLSSGAWYEVSKDFVISTNDSIAKIPPPPFGLMAWNGSDSEGDYNRSCSASCGFLNCDAKNVFFGGGHSQLEFCDMLGDGTKTLMFAKIVSKSSGMSHLTEQVRTSAQLLFSTDGEYRKKLVQLFATHYPHFDTAWLQSRPKNGDWNLCMVSLGKRALDLPFLAKCGLARTYKELTEQGHAVSFIDV
jgi:uncharacterized protein (TIGR04141 family)